MNSTVYNVDMFYDSYEADFGDGFYPMTKSSVPCTDPTTIGFKLTTDQNAECFTNVTYSVSVTTHSAQSHPLNVYWKQTNNNVIRGLDGNEGFLLFAQLNNQLRVDNTFVTVQGIVNSFGKIIYPKNT